MSDHVTRDATLATLRASAVLATQASPIIEAGVLEGSAAVKAAVGGAAQFALANPALFAAGAGVVAVGVGLYIAYQHFDEIREAASSFLDAIKEGWFELTATPEQRLQRANERLEELQTRYDRACKRLRTEIQNYKAEETEELRLEVQKARDRRKKAREALDKAEKKVDSLVDRMA